MSSSYTLLDALITGVLFSPPSQVLVEFERELLNNSFGMPHKRGAEIVGVCDVERLIRSCCCHIKGIAETVPSRALRNEHRLELSAFGAMVGHELWIGRAPVQIHVATGFLFNAQSVFAEEAGCFVNIFIFRKEDPDVVKFSVADN